MSLKIDQNDANAEVTNVKRTNKRNVVLNLLRKKSHLQVGSIWQEQFAACPTDRFINTRR